MVKFKDFVRDCLAQLEPAMPLAVDEYQGHYSKSKRNGLGMLRMTNGDTYRGSFKDDMRSGAGTCMLASGALYRGEWREDAPHGTGILYSGENEVIEARFIAGEVSDKHPVKLLLADGQYYEGPYSNHRRHGAKGKCYYANGDVYDGEWEADKRRAPKLARMLFADGTMYKGQFNNDIADGQFSVEDPAHALFQAETGTKPIDDPDDPEKKGFHDTGGLVNGRL